MARLLICALLAISARGNELESDECSLLQTNQDPSKLLDQIAKVANVEELAKTVYGLGSDIAHNADVVNDGQNFLDKLASGKHLEEDLPAALVEFVKSAGKHISAGRFEAAIDGWKESANRMLSENDKVKQGAAQLKWIETFMEAKKHMTLMKDPAHKTEVKEHMAGTWENVQQLMGKKAMPDTEEYIQKNTAKFVDGLQGKITDQLIEMSETKTKQYAQELRAQRREERRAELRTWKEPMESSIAKSPA